jgi:tetratricopeptide (TPR) repeat protein
LRQLVDNRWFALIDLLLVAMSAAAWMLIPQFGIGFSLIALLPWVLRFLAGYLPFQRTPFDWLIAIFLVTAWVGYWAAYDKSAAWIKVWLIVSAVLLYYALSAQPKQNLSVLSFLSFCFALALSLYFCLTYNFADIGGRFVIWWMNHRPQVDWPRIPDGYVSGLVLINTLFAFYWLWNTSKKSFGSAAVVMQLLLLLGMGMVALMFVLTVSRGIKVIALGVVGLWVLWRVSTWSGSNLRVRAVFPVLVLSYLVVLITFAFLGPASAAPDSAHSPYGKNSRAELLGRGAYFLVDYPITGAGLSSFPGLYSQYMLVIPQFYFTNSYNLFLDVAIEQGVIAGAIFILLYLGSVILVSRAIANHPPNELRFMRWLGLFALIVTIVHGLFYDYLYNGNGTALLFYPLGMAMVGGGNRTGSVEQAFQKPKTVSSSYRVIVGSLLAVIVILALNLNKIIPLWYANLGAVQMSQGELKDFPSNQWSTSDMVPRLELADTTFRSALQYEPRNRTANYRLGLISMLRQDFKTAAANLEIAYQEAPNHRGIIKSLGYCYVWLGEFDRAQALLGRIPETQNEMSVYTWWWETQGRPDLSERASFIISQLDPVSQ